MRFTILLFVLVLFSCQKNEVSPPKVPTKIEKLVFDYVQAWSERDLDYITDNTYGAPFVLFLEDTTIFLNDLVPPCTGTPLGLFNTKKFSLSFDSTIIENINKQSFLID